MTPEHRDSYFDKETSSCFLRQSSDLGTTREKGRRSKFRVWELCWSQICPGASKPHLLGLQKPSFSVFQYLLFCFVQSSIALCLRNMILYNGHQALGCHSLESHNSLLHTHLSNLVSSSCSSSGIIPPKCLLSTTLQGSQYSSSSPATWVDAGAAQLPCGAQ